MAGKPVRMTVKDDGVMTFTVAARPDVAPRELLETIEFLLSWWWSSGPARELVTVATAAGRGKGK